MVCFCGCGVSVRVLWVGLLKSVYYLGTYMREGEHTDLPSNIPSSLGHVDMTNQKLHALDIKTKLASLRTAIC